MLLVPTPPYWTVSYSQRLDIAPAPALCMVQSAQNHTLYKHKTQKKEKATLTLTPVDLLLQPLLAEPTCGRRGMML
jgi:hypothetical protein